MLVAGNAAPGNYAEIRNLRETMDDASGNANGEIFRVGVSARVGKRKHSNGLDRGATYRNGPARSVDRCEEAIATARQGFHESRIFRRITQRLPQLIYCLIQAMIEIDERVGRPKLAAQFLPSNYLAGLLQQHRQNLKRLLLKLDLYALFA